MLNPYHSVNYAMTDLNDKAKTAQIVRLAPRVY